MKTNDEFGRREGEDRFDQILRLVREIQGCVAELKRDFADLRGSVRDLKATHDSDWRVVELREDATVAWRGETRGSIIDIRKEIKEVREEIKALQMARQSAGMPLGMRELGYIGVGGAGLGWLIIEFVIKRGAS